MWQALNAASNAITALVLAPVARLGWFWQVLVLAVPLTALALLAFRYCSPQARIKRVRRLIQAYLLEMRLFQDDLRVVARAQGRVFTLSLRYLVYALPPLLVMIVPAVLVLSQIEARFAFRPLQPGERAMLVVARDGITAATPARLELPAGLAPATAALRLPARGEVRWLLRADAPGEHRARVHVDGQTLELPITVGGRGAAPLPSRYRGNSPLALLAPDAPALAGAGATRAVTLAYPRARGEFGGLSSAAWGLFALTMVLGFALRGRFGVSF